MNFIPHPYQYAAIKHLLSRQHGGLLLPVGLGKTSCALAATMMLRGRHFVKRTLLVAPLRAIYTTWPDELKKWNEFRGMTVKNLHAGEMDGDIEMVNPHQVARLVDAYPRRWDHLIVDESTDFKNARSQRFRALRNVLHHFRRRWILTGSPAPNGLMDVWSQAFILDRGDALGKFISHYRTKWFWFDGYGYVGKWFPREGAAEEIYDRLKPLMFRVDGADSGLKLPARVDNFIKVKLTGKARKDYEQMEKQFYLLTDDGSAILSPNAAAAGMRCRQIANGMIYDSDKTAVKIHSEKAAALRDLVDEQNGSPVLVFYEFRHDAQAIERALGYRVPNITEEGDTNQLVREWNEGKHTVMLAHPGSAGKALNLQARCSTVCFYGLPWALDHYDQGVGRVLRQGNTAETVVVHHIVAEDTLDERVLGVLADKARTQDAFNRALTTRIPR